MSEIQQATADIAVIQKSLPLLQSLPGLLTQHQASVSGAINAAQKLTEKCKEAGKMTAELDEECKTLIIKINKTDEKLKENRSPGTQLMTMIARAFTGEEGKLAAPVQELQGFRNQRAKEVVEENRRIEAEAKAKAARDKEKADVVAWFTKCIATCLNKKLFDRKKELTDNFETFTLDDFETRSEKLRALNNMFPSGKLDMILVYDQPRGVAFLTNVEVVGIEAEIKKGYPFDDFAKVYQEELDEVKRGLVDRIPSKKAELLEKRAAAERAEQLRLQQVEQIRQAELLKQQQQQAKNQQEKQRLEKLQQEQQLRQAQLEEERKEQERVRLENERLENERITAENIRLENERLEKQETADKQADIAHAGAIGNTLFDVANTAGQKQTEGETRRGWKITVTHMAGWAEIFQFWYMGKAAATPLDKFGKITLDQMKGYAEDQGDTEKISCKYLAYEETIVAVNRKVKASTKAQL